MSSGDPTTPPAVSTAAQVFFPAGIPSIRLGGSGEVGPAEGAMEDRMSALHDLFRQKQADLLVYYQQAQQDLAQQHVRYSQQLTQAFDAEKRRQESAALEASRVAAIRIQQAQVLNSLQVGSASMVNLHTGLKAARESELSSGGGGGTLADQMLRRTASTGSGAISNNTRERLVNLLKSKQKAKEGGRTASFSSGSHGRYRTDPYPVPAVSIRNSSTVISSSALAPTKTHAQHQGLFGPNGADFELRKVSSEPNLKMRRRLRELLRQRRTPPATIGGNSSAFKSPTGLGLSRHVSASTTSLLGSIAEGPRPSTTLPLAADDEPSHHPPPLHPIFPSPSLPNIPNLTPELASALLAASGCGGGGGGPALSAVANHLSQSLFLSMPSLFPFPGLNPPAPPMGVTLPLSTAPTHALSSSASELVDGSGSTLKHAAALDQGGLRISGVGGDRLLLPPQSAAHPNLLKQQIRDLVLRRKSFVREETEEELHPREPGPKTASARRTGLAFDSAMSKHACMCGQNKEHVEHGGRIHSIWARLQEKGLVERCEKVIGRKAPIDWLKLVHSDTYVTFFAISPTACLKLVESCRDPSQLPLTNFVRLSCGGYGVDSDTYFNDASTQLAARLAAGNVTELAISVAEGRVLNGFAVVRPPGHHAEKDQAMGFCYFNNVSVAASVLQQRRAAAGKAPWRIAIVDWDVHHGNGTQMAFEEDPDVLYLSLHRHDNGNFFPGTGAVTDSGSGQGRHLSVNVSWSGGVMGDAEYLGAWRVVVEPVLTQFRPELILVSCGFDGTKGHSPALGGYDLSPAIFGFMTRRLMAFAEGKVVLALEGGYELAGICDASELVVSALLGPSSEAGEVGDPKEWLSEEALHAVPSKAAQETLQKVVAVQKNFWKSLVPEAIGVSEAAWETSVQSRFADLSVDVQD